MILRELVNHMAALCGNDESQWLVERSLVFDPPVPDKPYRTRVIGPQQKGSTSMNVCAWASTLDGSTEHARRMFLAAALIHIDSAVSALRSLASKEDALNKMRHKLQEEEKKP